MGLNKRAAVLFSGGKDSTYACSKAIQSGYEISCLITMFPLNSGSYMLHSASIEASRLSAQAMGFKHYTAETSGKESEELADIANAISTCRQEHDFDTIVTGGIASIYQKTRIQKIANDCRVDVFSPLWGINQEKYMRALLSENYRFILTSISAGGLGKEWIGKEMGPNELDKLIDLSLKYQFNLSFEGGEAETLVLDCPIFRFGRIRILQSKVDWNGYFGSLNILNAVLEPKVVIEAN
jgi:diphthine-ammonia ligase